MSMSPADYLSNHSTKMQDSMSPELVCFMFQLHGHRQIHWTKIKPSDFLHSLSQNGVSDVSACGIPHCEFHSVILMSRKEFQASTPAQRVPNGHQKAGFKFFAGSTKVMDSAKDREIYVKYHLKLQAFFKKSNRLVWKKNSFLKLHCSIHLVIFEYKIIFISMK